MAVRPRIDSEIVSHYVHSHETHIKIILFYFSLLTLKSRLLAITCVYFCATIEVQRLYLLYEK